MDSEPDFPVDSKIALQADKIVLPAEKVRKHSQSDTRYDGGELSRECRGRENWRTTAQRTLDPSGGRKMAVGFTPCDEAIRFKAGIISTVFGIVPRSIEAEAERAETPDRDIAPLGLD